jgi:hypothetical protein
MERFLTVMRSGPARPRSFPDTESSTIEVMADAVLVERPAGRVHEYHLLGHIYWAVARCKSPVTPPVLQSLTAEAAHENECYHRQLSVTAIC